MTKFQLGDRVQFSPEWLAVGLQNREQRVGTVIGFGRGDTLPCTRVRWDGNAHAGKYSNTFLELVPDSIASERERPTAQFVRESEESANIKGESKP